MVVEKKAGIAEALRAGIMNAISILEENITDIDLAVEAAQETEELRKEFRHVVDDFKATKVRRHRVCLFVPSLTTFPSFATNVCDL